MPVPIGDVTLVVLEAGRGGRPLLLAHGFGGAKEDFAEVVPVLAGRGWHVVAPDLRGHGESDHPPGPGSYSLHLFAADLLALADGLGWGRFVLLGHSLGGMAAQLLALDHPERLSGLVLMDTSPGPPEISGPGDPTDTPAQRRLLAERPGYREFMDRKLAASSPDMTPPMVRDIMDPVDRLPALATLAVPTLVVVGEQDHAFVGPSRAMAAAIPGARLAVVPDAGHSPQFEAPAAWWAAVGSFLDDLAAASPPPAHIEPKEEKG